MAEPDAYVILNVGQKTEESNVIQNSTDPRWEQGFRFLVHDPNLQDLDVKVNSTPNRIVLKDVVIVSKFY